MFFQNFSLQQGASRQGTGSAGHARQEAAAVGRTCACIATASRQGAGSAGHERQEETSSDVLPKLQRLAGHAHALQQQAGRAQDRQELQVGRRVSISNNILAMPFQHLSNRARKCVTSLRPSLRSLETWWLLEHPASSFYCCSRCLTPRGPPPRPPHPTQKPRAPVLHTFPHPAAIAIPPDGRWAVWFGVGLLVKYEDVQQVRRYKAPADAVVH